MTSTEDIRMMRERAQKFSDALEVIAHRENIMMLGSNSETCFPKGGCGMSSRLFGHFLLTDGIITNYVEGTHRDQKGTCHAWLEYEGCIIDLTCCQFDDTRSPLPACPHECPFVSKLELEWHSVNWPKESRTRLGILETHLTESEKVFLDEIGKAMSKNAIDD